MKLKSGFKRTINWNKHQSEATIETQNQYLDYLSDPSVQGVNRLFCLIIWKKMHLEQYTQDVFSQL